MLNVLKIQEMILKDLYKKENKGNINTYWYECKLFDNDYISISNGHFIYNIHNSLYFINNQRFGTKQLDCTTCLKNDDYVILNKTNMTKTLPNKIKVYIFINPNTNEMIYINENYLKVVKNLNDCHVYGKDNKSPIYIYDGLYNNEMEYDAMILPIHVKE